MRRCIILMCMVAVAMFSTSSTTVAKTSLGVNAETTLNSVVLAYTTSKTTRTSLQLGTDQTYGLVIPEKAQANHRITVGGLRPATQYYYRVSSVTKNRTRVLFTGSFATKPVGPAKLTVTSGGLQLDGQPFFPVGTEVVSCPSLKTVASDLATGVSMFKGYGGACGPPNVSAPLLHDLLAEKAWWIEGSHDDYSSLPELLGLPSDMSGYYNPYLVGCDSHSAKGFYDDLRELLGTGQPVMSYLYLTTMYSPSDESCITPARLSALFWTSVAVGVQMIMYQTELPWAANSRTNSGFQVKPEVQQRSLQLVKQLAAIQPAMLSKATDSRVFGNTVIRASFRRYRGTTYVVAVNASDQRQKASFTVGSKLLKQAAVWREGRKLKVKSGIISDNFLPFQTHIYLLRT